MRQSVRFAVVVCIGMHHEMVDAVNRCGGNAKLTVYPENEHDAWSDTYKNPKVFEWLLSCENQNMKELMEQYKGSNLYG